MCSSNYTQIENEEPSEPERLVEAFYLNYEKDLSESLKSILKTNPDLISDENYQTILRSIKEGQSKAGKYFGHEKILSRHIGKSVILLSYLAKHQKFPIRYTFTFYKPNNDWLLYDFKFDSDIMKELEKSSQLEFASETYRSNIVDWTQEKN